MTKLTWAGNRAARLVKRAETQILVRTALFTPKDKDQIILASHDFFSSIKDGHCDFCWARVVTTLSFPTPGHNETRTPDIELCWHTRDMALAQMHDWVHLREEPWAIDQKVGVSIHWNDGTAQGESVPDASPYSPAFMQHLVMAYTQIVLSFQALERNPTAQEQGVQAIPDHAALRTFGVRLQNLIAHLNRECGKQTPTTFPR